MKTKRKLVPEIEERFFKEYGGVVYGAIKKLGIPRSHPDYDDYVQQGLIKLVEAYETFPGELEKEEDFVPFGGYAYRKVRWSLLDGLRKQQKKKEREVGLPETFDTLFPDSASLCETDVIEKEWLLKVLDRLNPEEQQYVLDVVSGKMPTQMAEAHGVSRKTIYKRRKRIAEKLRDGCFDGKN